MKDVFMINLPSSTSKSDVELIQNMLKQIDSVEDAVHKTTRVLDPVSITVLVTLVGSILGVVGTAVPIICKIVETIRGKGISGAKIKLANGNEISVDNASVSEIERIMKASEQK